MRRGVILLSVCMGGCTSLLGIDDLRLRDGAIDPDAAIGTSDGPDAGTSVEHVLVFQDNGTYTGTRDTYIRSDQAITHGGDAEARWEQSNDKHMLLRFESIFGAGVIPPGATIAAATLRLVVRDDGDPALMRETAIDWNENVTFATFGLAPGVNETDLGADVATVAAPLGAIEVDVKASLARWSVNPAANHGWIFIPQGMTNVAVATADSTVLADRPLLTVTYLE